jgi:serine/threonine protein kinase
VRRATHCLSKVIFAIKIISKLNLNDQFMQNLQQEVTILQLLKHRYVIRLEEILASQTMVYLVLEFASGGELLQKNCWFIEFIKNFILCPSFMRFFKEFFNCYLKDFLKDY